MRTPPALRIAARSVAMKGSKPLALKACGENAVSPQSCPRLAEQVGRRADAQVQQQVALSRPCVTAARTHPDCKIGDQADAHAAVARRLLNGRKTAVRDPLQKHVKLDCGSLGLRKATHMRILESTPAVGPFAPVPILPRAVPVHVQRFEQRMLMQAIAAGVHE